MDKRVRRLGIQVLAVLSVMIGCTGEDTPVVMSGADAGSGSSSGNGADGAAMACTATERTCVGAEMRGCNPEGTGFSATALETCATPALCRAGLAGGKCSPPACDVGEVTCSGHDRQTCNADRTGFEKTEACSGAKPECADGVCVECQTDAVDCIGLSTPRKCVANTWQNQTACGGNVMSSCSGGACIDVRIARWEMPNDANSTIRPIKYTIVSANIVRDEVTKLEWQRGVSPAPIDVQGGARHAYCRSLELDGQVGWHLPSTVELVSLLDYSKAAPHLDTTVFTGTPTGDANTGLVGGEYSVTSPRVNYDNGLVETESITGGSYYVRCVRSTVAPPTGQRFSVSNGEVTDAYTKLVWQQAQSTMTSPTKAPEKCASPWRLPTAKELYTILDPTQTTPYFDHTVFNGNNDWHFTSTLAPADLSKRIVIDFSKPQGVFLTGTVDGWVRCVK